MWPRAEQLLAFNIKYHPTTLKFNNIYFDINVLITSNRYCSIFKIFLVTNKMQKLKCFQNNQNMIWILFYIFYKQCHNYIPYNEPHFPNMTMLSNFRWRRWGSSLPGWRRLDPPLSPPSTPVEFCWSTCLQSHLKTSPPTPQNSYLKFQNRRTTPSGNNPLVHPKLA